MPSLHTINIILLVVYLPIGFMGWAFAAGAAAQTDNPRMSWFSKLFFLPPILIVCAIFADSIASGQVAYHLERAPLYGLAGLVGLVLVAAVITGFVQGVKGSEKG